MIAIVCIVAFGGVFVVDDVVVANAGVSWVSSTVSEMAQGEDNRRVKDKTTMEWEYPPAPPDTLRINLKCECNTIYFLWLLFKGWT